MSNNSKINHIADVSNMVERACPMCGYPHCNGVQYCHDCNYNFEQFSSEDADDGYPDLDNTIRKEK